MSKIDLWSLSDELCPVCSNPLKDHWRGRPCIGQSQYLMSEQARLRSSNYHQMSAQEQWEEDKRLGILDWDGK